jgi:MAternally-affected-uncoordination protein
MSLWTMYLLLTSHDANTCFYYYTFASLHIKIQQCLGLLFYNELLHIFYRFRICDYKNVQQHVDKLDAAMKADLQQTRHIQELSEELNALNQSLSCSDLHYRDRSALSEKQVRLQARLKSMTRLSSTGKHYLEPAHFGNMRGKWEDKLELAPPPIDGEWLPKSAVYVLVDLMVVIFGRPKGLFKECGKRIQSGMHTIQGLVFWTTMQIIFLFFGLLFFTLL